MKRVLVWVDCPALLAAPRMSATAAIASLEGYGPSAATAAVSQSDVAKTSSLVHSLKQAIDRLIDMIEGESDEQRRRTIERKKQDLDLKLQQQKKVLKDMRDYVQRLMGKLEDLQKVIKQTVEKQGQKAAAKLKAKYNELYRSYYGRDHYSLD